MKKVLCTLLTTSLILVLIAGITGCNSTKSPDENTGIPVLFDTDANNELDDQHALAYLLLNGESLETVGITANATYNGGSIEGHVKEAERVIRLMDMYGEVPLLAGANGNFPEISPHVDQAVFDGSEAVDFIIAEALKERSQKLVLLPVGKLTNIALALQKEPAIAAKVRIVWLGSNYPDPGEYNLVNDTASLNYILDFDVAFEMVTVSYGKATGTAAVMASQTEINERMPGLGPQVEEAVEGRHGGSYYNFGDYSVNLFEHIDYHDEGKHRSLFDMAAVAIVKNPSWAKVREIPAPLYTGGVFVDRPDNPRKILLWEHFDREAIMADFYSSFR